VGGAGGGEKMRNLQKSRRVKKGVGNGENRPKKPGIALASVGMNTLKEGGGGKSGRRGQGGEMRHKEKKGTVFREKGRPAGMFSYNNPSKKSKHRRRPGQGGTGKGAQKKVKKDKCRVKRYWIGGKQVVNKKGPSGKKKFTFSV